MIHPYGPIAYSLMKRQDGANSGLIACNATMISATAIVPAAATRAAIAACGPCMADCDDAPVVIFPWPPLCEVSQCLRFRRPTRST
jgi:hypothetical protein